MGSKFLCDCGETIRTNLFEGHNLKILVSENDIDKQMDEENIKRIIEKSEIVVKCNKCNSIYIIDKNSNIVKWVKETS